jgi:hypothetical protein
MFQEKPTKYMFHQTQRQESDECLTASSMICTERSQLDAKQWFTELYIPLNMFRALLCPSSGAQDNTGDYSMWYITLRLRLVVWSGAGL